jgi:hypothetical protein
MRKQTKPIFLLVHLFLLFATSYAQVTLNANGPGGTYELINSVLAPGYNAVEDPDASHTAFGRHIAEVFDATLNKNVFEFYSHITPDDDPQTGSPDRQRVEIKTYNQSPANLIGTTGETVTYKWYFRVPTGYQPSTTFTHLHQIKPVDGDDGDPLFTLTPRKGTPNKMELIYDADGPSAIDKKAIVNLSLFEGNWVEATEKILVGTAGTYSMVIKKVSDGTVLLSYANNNIGTIRATNSFIRPKWGIYRSIANPGDLRDEAVRFSDFSISEAALLAGSNYYWVGGTGGNWSDATSWNTSLDGSGLSRTVADPADVLIFDGTNIGGSTPTTGTVTPGNFSTTTIGQLILQNAATVVLRRTAAATGTTSLNINGDGTPADDLVVSSNSSLTVEATTASFGLNVILGVVTTQLSTGTIFGSLTIRDNGVAATARVTVPNVSSLNIANGATVTTLVSNGTNYPFGSGATSPAGANPGIVFLSGSKCIFNGGNSVFSNTSTHNAVRFEKGSLLEMSTAQPAGLFGNRTLANVLVKSPAVITLTDNFLNIDSLTINSGATFSYRTTGGSPIAGNIVNNGVFGGAAGVTTGNLIFLGNVPQTVSGSGTFNSLGNITVATDADVTTNNNLSITGTSTSSVLGKLNVQSNTIGGTGNFQLRPAATATSNATLTANSAAVVVDNTVYNGTTNTANIAVGTLVTGTGIPANSYIIATSSATSTFTMSKAATAAGATSITVSNTAPTLATSNSGGVDGSIITSGTKTYGSGANVTINGATTAPFPAASTNAIGNLIINAAVTTNKTNQTVSNSVTLNTGILTIRSTDTIRVSSGNAIAGAPFSTSKYIVSERSGNNLGVLRMDNLNVATLFPIGSATNYLPVTLTPTSAMSFAGSAFEGLTLEGTPTGTAFNAAQKANAVDAVWIINRINGTGDCGMELNWPSSLEGSAFTGFANAEIGIGRHDGTEWTINTGSGDNAANTAVSLFSNFSPFAVGKIGLSLPIKLKSFTTNKIANGNIINWTVEEESGVVLYEIQKSSNGSTFNALTNVIAANKQRYSFEDKTTTVGKAYYRLKVILANGDVKYSYIVSVDNNNVSLVTVYPNPVADKLYVQNAVGINFVKVSTAAGTVVLSKNNTSSSIELNVSALAAGMYIIELYGNGQVKHVTKFVKQ